MDKAYKKAQRMFSDYLLDKGYPRNSIKCDYRLNYFELGNDNAHYMFDIALVDEQNRIKEYYEIKTTGWLTAKDVEQQTAAYHEALHHDEFRNLVTNNALGFYVLFEEGGEDFKIFLLSAQIATLSQYVDVVTSLLTHKSSVKFFYRGQSDVQYDPCPGIYRDPKIAALETKLYKEAIRRCPEEFSSINSTFQHLVKLQHYGIPTRLLDLTTNALIALYFAVEKYQKVKDGCVYLFKVRDELIKAYDSDAVSVVSNLARLKTFNMPSEYKSREEFNDTEEIGYLLHEIRYEKPHFSSVIEPADLNKTFCVLPKLDNPRIRQQNGAFFLFGIGQDKSECSKLDEHPIRIIIDASCKEQLKQELAQFGICDSFVYPEMEHVANEIKREFNISR